MTTCSNLDCFGKSRRNHHRCGRCRQYMIYTCAMCGDELSNNKRVFCKDCIWTRNAWVWRDSSEYKCEICNKVLVGRQRRVCSVTCSNFLRYSPKKRYCKMCFVYKPKGTKPMCEGDCKRLYMRLAQQVSRERNRGQ